MPRRGDNTFDHSEIIALAKEGTRQPLIAEQLDCSLSTVTKVIRGARAAGESIPTPRRAKREALAGPQPAKSKSVSSAPVKERGPRSPMEEPGFYESTPGVSAEDADRVRTHLLSKGMPDIAEMLGLVPSAVAS